MSEDRRANTESTRLPKELVDRLTKPFARFLRIEAGGGGVLLLFIVAALVVSNSPWAQQRRFRGFVSSRELLEADLSDSRDLVGKLNDDYYEARYEP